MREDPGEEEEDGESEYGTPEARVNNDAGVLVHSPPSSSSLESYPSSSVKKKKFASSFVTNTNDEEKKKKTSRTREDPTTLQNQPVMTTWCYGRWRSSAFWGSWMVMVSSKAR